VLVKMLSSNVVQRIMNGHWEISLEEEEEEIFIY